MSDFKSHLEHIATKHYTELMMFLSMAILSLVPKETQQKRRKKYHKRG